jgi:hypothetical protein
MAEEVTYTDQKEYRKYLASKCSEGHSHEEESCCEGCADKDSKCTCCPVGLVAVYEDNGAHVACLTPNDADIYHKRSFTCADGYVKLYRNDATPEFLGCVPSDEFAALYAAVNPVAP